MNTNQIHQAIYAIATDHIAKNQDGNPFAHHIQHDYYTQELGLDSDAAWERWEQEQETPPEGEELNKFLYWYFFNIVLSNALSDTHSTVYTFLASAQDDKDKDILRSNVDEAIHRIDIHCPEVQDLIKQQEPTPATTYQKVDLFYRCGANYKTHIIAAIAIGTDGLFQHPLNKGEEITAEQLGFTDAEDFVTTHIGDYSPDYDHNILTIADILPDNTEAEFTFDRTAKNL